MKTESSRPRSHHEERRTHEEVRTVYVCIKVVLRGVPMEKDVQLGLGEGPIKSGSNVPTSRVPLVPSHANWLILAQAHSVANFTLGN